ncbi:pyrroline-5-carboxylate reductase [Sulfuricella sp.]|uniref:pyrroline-5-carboxylate reductase n=1 Tax=Sulfuricella sp. TaxID=2099377 RepID=UPI002CC2B04B|nr:pyrroline-5-carboxylate reductase [Sulfuricella sp.]HUX63273.1 pyrroline-5-carboxylate reductase [Sulfuricella sp.]
MNITFIGGGNMAGALISGLLQKGFDPKAINVVEISAEGRAHLSEKFGVATQEEIGAAAISGDIVVLAVKPQQLFGVAAQLHGLLDGKLVISIAAGVRSADLSRWLGGHTMIVRAMPNTPAMVLAGVTGLCALPEVPENQRSQAETILGAVGMTLWLEREEQMDAITAISGSGPAYVFLFIEALQEAAVGLGLTPDQARALSLETFLGATKLALQSSEDAATLRARVTSKGGTTESAILVMESAGIKRVITQAAQAACLRSRELGDELGKIGAGGS